MTITTQNGTVDTKTIISEILAGLTIDGSDSKLRLGLIKTKLTDLVIKKLGSDEVVQVVQEELEKRNSKSLDFENIDNIVMNALYKAFPVVNSIEKWENSVFYNTLTEAYYVPETNILTTEWNV